ncbi:MAG: hypothetical protein JO168_02115 [Solirubrobacterales bacterium]|nr:hypothetical protein [Solirubrobacterales bacterium]
MTFVAAYFVWRAARRLILLVVLGGLVLVLLAEHRRLPAGASHLRHAAQTDLHQAEQGLGRVFEKRLRGR